MPKLREAVILGFILFLCAAPFARAQSFTGIIYGTVTDSTGAVVPRATISVVNMGTGARAEVFSDAGGEYRAVELPPGSYIVEVSATGFKKSRREGIVLEVQQSARVDVGLELGAVTETVSVTADAPLLESTTSTVGKVVDNRRIMNLPLNTRNVYSLIFLTPGVVGSVSINYDDMRYSVNGARVRMLDTLIDGISSAHPTVNGAGGISVFPSVDAIDEFKVLGANYAAEYGRSHGSVLNVVFKSGANNFHGSAFEFLRNSVFDANNFFDNRRGQELASFKRSQFGGMLSGPIRRDKTFFMADYEGLRERSFATNTFTVPTELERKGDFSQTLASNGQLIRMFNPFTTRANPSGSGFIRDAFTNNMIPSGLFDPVGVNVLKYFPLPNAVGNPVTHANNYSQSGSNAINLDQWDVRVDHNFSARQKLFARYSHRFIENAPPAYFPKDLTIAEGRVIQENHGRGVVADYTNTLSPTTILSARLGFSRTLFVFANQGLGFLPSSLGLPKDIDAAVDRQMFPRFGASGYVSLGGNDHRRSGFNTGTLLVNLTRVRGPHTMKTGFEGRILRVNVWEARDAGNFSFSAGMTQGPNPSQASSTAGNSIASLLLGTGSTGTLIQAWKNVAAQSFYYAGYVQDDWRITPKLTLNLGVRYDLDTPRTERYNRVNYFDPSVPSPLAQKVPQFPNLRGGLVFVGVGGRDRHQYDWDTNNFAPRLGLAYQLTPRTVIRAGYGHVFGISPQEAIGTVGPFGFRVENPWVNSLDGITPFNLLKNPFPQGFQPPPGASQGLLTQAGANLQAVLRDTVTPWTMQWNFTIQRELPAQVLLEVGYVGTRGLQLSRGGESGFTLNQLPTEQMALGSRLNELVDNPFFGIVNNGVLIGSKVSRAQLLRPYPQFTTIQPLFSSGSSSTYHSLQVTAKKRLSRGFQFETAYTWAKTLDNGESHQDSYNIRASRALSDIDLAQRLIVSYIYDLPFGSGRRFGTDASPLLNLFIGGWQFNGITTFQTGTPLGISASGTAVFFSEAARANNNGKSGKLSGAVDRRLDAYFDKSVFSQPLAFTFGNMGPRLPDIRNDGVRNFDLSVFKNFTATERLNVQFRAEFLNAFNTPRFGGPNTSVTSTSFGVISSQANAPRQIQFGLKFLW